ncbi:winged helix-turn-helix DNA-binding domain protein [Vibrio phage 2.275.O._10N.286.54.E11]|nr:winged helix-turn-helix DNA-binding domain protein [Vibrio phage 2.275.O._10N.286.54.E11]
MPNDNLFRRWKGDSTRSPNLQKPKKMDLDKAYDMVVAVLSDKERVYAEVIAAKLNIERHVVKQVFHKLNLEGKMSKAQKWGGWRMHTRYDMHGDDPVQWEANWYNVYTDKF